MKSLVTYKERQGIVHKTKVVRGSVGWPPGKIVPEPRGTAIAVFVLFAGLLFLMHLR